MRFYFLLQSDRKRSIHQLKQSFHSPDPQNREERWECLT